MKIYAIVVVLIAIAAAANTVAFILLRRELERKENELREMKRKITAEMINEAANICNRRNCSKCVYNDGLPGGMCKCNLIADYINRKAEGK